MANHQRRRSQLRSITAILLLLCYYSTSYVSVANNDKDDITDKELQANQVMQFFRACQNGPLQTLQSILQDHSDWIHTRRTATGETCLHLASISGQMDVIEWLLDQLSVNAGSTTTTSIDERTVGDRTMRETPLSMCVKNGHVQAARLLLEAGADVNVDFDSMMGGLHSVTVMDIMAMILPSKLPDNPSPTTRNYMQMRELLLEYGGQRWSDLQTASEL